MRGRVLVVAGSDSGGGAGLQADIKTIAAFGAYSMTAITALTAQDTLGVKGIYPVPAQFVRQQMEVVLADIGADAIKTGMLGDADLIETVASVLEREAAGIPMVLDPVMTAKGGATLLASEAVQHLKRRLFPMACVLTPNIPEAEILTGRTIDDVSGMHAAADALLRHGVGAVLLKGGHLPGDDVVDILATRTGAETFRAPRIDTRHTHGTGCTLASAIAASLAQGVTLMDAVVRARIFVRSAITSAPGFGKGHGPLNHSVLFDSNV